MTTANPTAASATSADDLDDAPRSKRAWLRAGVVGLLAFVGVVGLLHHPAASPILRALSPASVCPVMRGTPEQIDRAHHLGAAAIRASAARPAPARPALGFTLDVTRREDIDAWAAKHRISCSSIAGNETLRRCASVAPAALGQPAALGPVDELELELSTAGVLVNAQTTRRALTAGKAAATAQAIEAELANAIGPPTTTGGEPTAAHLGAGLLRSYVAEHVYTDYRASVTATNLASTGVMVREQYLSARP